MSMAAGFSAAGCGTLLKTHPSLELHSDLFLSCGHGRHNTEAVR